jgi:2'-5' RNA ligase
MAIVSISVPQDISSQLSSIDVPGELVSPSDMHITMVYLGKGISLSTMLKATAVCRMLAKKRNPFLVGTALVSSFPENEDGIPIIAKIVSPSIKSIRDDLISLLQKFGIDYNNKYPDFTPHVTLSYSKTEMDDFRIFPVQWKVGSLNIWGDDYG